MMTLTNLFSTWSRPLPVLIVAAGLLASPVTFAADEIHWTITGQTSVTFDWRGTITENTIRYGPAAGSYTGTVTAVSPSSPNEPFSSSGPFWEAKLIGLQENTLYHYSIAGGADHTFRTPPPRGSSNFTVYAEGDIGDSVSYIDMPIVQSLITGAAFVLAIGDLTYANTQGQAAGDQHFNDVMVWSRDAAYMPAWGNHEWEAPQNACGLTCGSACSTQNCDDLRNYKGRFDFPNPQASPGSPSISCCGEDWYWFDYGNVRFIAYPEPWSSAWGDWNTKATLLMDAAQSDPAIKFIVTFGHRPAYSSGSAGGSPTLKGFMDALGANHNKYVLNVNGHSHNYERTYPQNGVVHLTVGTGGSGQSFDGSCNWPTCAPPSWSAFRAHYHGAVRLRFGANGIEAEFICGPSSSGDDINGVPTTCTLGSTIDSYTIGIVPDTRPPVVSITSPAQGAVVSGPIDVVAAASDNQGVVGVRFKLNGSDLGSEDTAAPYTISWETASVTDGAYTLTAVARDAAGNTSTSSPVTVNVNNAGVYFVDKSDPACSDTGPGSSLVPYCTISAAANVRGGPGTTIFVWPGTYRETVTVPASGVAGRPFTFKALGAVVVDGADDFTAPSKWSLYSGDVWLASSVNWSPAQAFADGARLTASSAAPASLPARTFRYISGTGLFVNAGGGNPGPRQALIGRRLYGFRLTGRSWVTIDGFTVSRTEDRGIRATSSSDNIQIVNNTVTFTNKNGIYLSDSTGVLVRSNIVSDNNDHGIYLTTGTTDSIVEDNESFRNARPGSTGANGIRLAEASGIQLLWNRLHDNQDTGLFFSSSSNNGVSVQNLSWNNGDHGFDHSSSTGTRHVNDVAWHNFNNGIAVGGSSTGTKIHNTISVDNGLASGNYDLMVDSSSSSGFVSNYNIFWNSTGQAPIRHISTRYGSIAAFTLATGQDAQSLQANPQFRIPAQGNFHLLANSPAIDSADSSVPNWPVSDADGNSRVDDPSTTDRGVGPVHFADRGALEYLPSGSPPIADLSVSPSIGTAPLPVTLDASGSGDPDGTITSYLFDFGDFRGAGPQPDPVTTHTYDLIGDWSAKVTVTDNDGKTDSATTLVNVGSTNEPPDGSVETPNTGVTIPAGQTVIFTGSGVDPEGHLPLAFFWNFDGGASDQTVEDPGPVTFGTPGVFTVTLTVTDGLGAADPTPDSRMITVNAPNQAPNGVIDAPPGNVSITAGQSVSFSGTGSDSDGNLPLTFLWNFGGGAPNRTVEDPGPVTFSTPGTYSVTFTVTDALGVADPTPDGRVITVNPVSNQAPNGVIDAPPGNVSITAGQSVSFSGTGSDPDGNLPLTFLWNFAGGAPNRTVEDPGPVTFSTPGTYTVTFTVTDGLGLADPTPDGRVVTVIASNQTPNGVIDTPSTNVTIEAGQSVSFSGTGSDPDGNLPLTFLWTFGGGATNRTVEDPGPVTFSTPGTYTVTFTVTDNLGLTDPTPASRVVTVNQTTNLVANPSFESGTSGWTTYGSSTLQRVSGGVDGLYSLEMTSPPATAGFGVNDHPNWIVTTPAAGKRYRFTAWVMSPSSTGQTRLRVREYQNSVQLGSTTYSPAVTLTPGWQMITVDCVSLAAGTTLDLQVQDVPVAAGEVFRVDNISIRIIP